MRASTHTWAAARRFDIDPGHDNGQRRVAFGGDGVSLTEDLAACANGGQVVLSEAGWAAVQEQLPGACQVGPGLPALCLIRQQPACKGVLFRRARSLFLSESVQDCKKPSCRRLQLSFQNMITPCT